MYIIHLFGWTLRYVEEGQLESEGDVLMVSSQDEILGKCTLCFNILLHVDYVDILLLRFSI